MRATASTCKFTVSLWGARLSRITLHVHVIQHHLPRIVSPKAVTCLDVYIYIYIYDFTGHARVLPLPCWRRCVNNCYASPARLQHSKFWALFLSIQRSINPTATLPYKLDRKGKSMEAVLACCRLRLTTASFRSMHHSRCRYFSRGPSWLYEELQQNPRLWPDDIPPLSKDSDF